MAKAILLLWQMFLIQNKKLYKDMISKDQLMEGRQKHNILMLQKKIMILKIIENQFQLIQNKGIS